MAAQTVILYAHFIVECYDALALDAYLTRFGKQILIVDHLVDCHVVFNLGPVFGQLALYNIDLFGFFPENIEMFVSLYEMANNVWLAVLINNVVFLIHFFNPPTFIQLF